MKKLKKIFFSNKVPFFVVMLLVLVGGIGIILSGGVGFVVGQSVEESSSDEKISTTSEKSEKSSERGEKVEIDTKDSPQAVNERCQLPEIPATVTGAESDYRWDSSFITMEGTSRKLMVNFSVREEDTTTDKRHFSACPPAELVTFGRSLVYTFDQEGRFYAISAELINDGSGDGGQRVELRMLDPRYFGREFTVVAEKVFAHSSFGVGDELTAVAQQSAPRAVAFTMAPEGFGCGSNCPSISELLAEIAEINQLGSGVWLYDFDSDQFQQIKAFTADQVYRQDYPYVHFISGQFLMLEYRLAASQKRSEVYRLGTGDFISLDL